MGGGAGTPHDLHTPPPRRILWDTGRWSWAGHILLECILVCGSFCSRNKISNSHKKCNCLLYSQQYGQKKYPWARWSELQRYPFTYQKCQSCQENIPSGPKVLNADTRKYSIGRANHFHSWQCRKIFYVMANYLTFLSEKEGPCDQTFYTTALLRTVLRVSKWSQFASYLVRQRKCVAGEI